MQSPTSRTTYPFTHTNTMVSSPGDSINARLALRVFCLLFCEFLRFPLLAFGFLALPFRLPFGFPLLSFVFIGLLLRRRLLLFVLLLLRRRLLFVLLLLRTCLFGLPLRFHPPPLGFLLSLKLYGSVRILQYRRNRCKSFHYADRDCFKQFSRISRITERPGYFSAFIVTIPVVLPIRGLHGPTPFPYAID